MTSQTGDHGSTAAAHAIPKPWSKGGRTSVHNGALLRRHRHRHRTRLPNSTCTFTRPM
ncbi:MAG: hypothetical protein ACRDPJ_18935 [Nocardioidaceae bacterium]